MKEMSEAHTQIKIRKNHTYCELHKIIDAYQSLKVNADEKLAVTIVLLTYWTELELTMFYDSIMGSDRGRSLKKQIESAKKRLQKIIEPDGLESQWNPNFVEWIESQLLRNKKEQGDNI